MLFNESIIRRRTYIHTALCRWAGNIGGGRRRPKIYGLIANRGLWRIELDINLQKTQYMLVGNADKKQDMITQKCLLMNTFEY